LAFFSLNIDNVLVKHDVFFYYICAIILQALHMLRKSTFILVGIIAILNALPAQNDAYYLVRSGDNLAIRWIVEPGNTLFSICNKFDIEPSQIIHSNGEPVQPTIKLGDTLFIQLQSNRMTTNPGEDLLNSKKLYYEVSPGDNLFRISRIYLGIHEELLMVLNHKENTDIKVGETLFAGFYLPSKKHSSQLEIVSSESEIDQTVKLVERHPEAPVAPKVMKEQRGVALWFTDTSNDSGYFILHPTARPNTIVYITNPMFSKTIQAKVAGNLPPDTYPKEVIAVVSPGVAKALGALDSRFFVKIQFEENELALQSRH
jgi:hypothetical protein